MIRLICFDIDDTLMDFHKGERIAFYETMRELNIKCNEKDYRLYEKINQALWKKLEKGEIEKKRLRVLRFEQLKAEGHFDFDADAASALYPEYLSKQCFLLDETVEVVKKCAQIADLAAATNGIAAVQRSRMKKSGLEPYFKYFFISEEIGYEKPQLPYFEEIFKISGVKPEEILFVGDSLSADIAGAVQSGCISVWLNPAHLINDSNFKSAYEIERLSDIFDIMEELK